MIEQHHTPLNIKQIINSYILTSNNFSLLLTYLTNPCVHNTIPNSLHNLSSTDILKRIIHFFAKCILLQKVSMTATFTLPLNPFSCFVALLRLQQYVVLIQELVSIHE